ncbi:adenosine deaminase [Austwickia chelonae]|uniref:adenosine deaminase n=1 Tax=Austwickia chelonae NBRC 105200 TaxID=1184607 RepID=K6VAB7_9MICO|nr:adenosine deaminase [Austwickia chelonae]GAB79178.1 adenosine deaminase [Austwickia chelonae NBRC 105200]SEW36987.1 adenosine deaminase [Austwickia chelonae]
MTLTRDQLRALPKVSLHDHLDGALRPQTIIELAEEIGWQLPDAAADGDAALRDWFYEASTSGSLELYLQTFTHVVAVLQTPESLTRIAREYVHDLAADGVVYGETRWAPEQHTQGEMTMRDAVQAVAAGLVQGMAECAQQGHPIVVRQLLCSMRHNEPSTEVAELALEFKDRGVAGFDIAGAEDGFPADRFASAFATIRAGGGHSTAHAGEADGPESIRQAVIECGAERVGHGVRIMEDICFDADSPKLGKIATYLRDHHIPLEVCPTSNVQTGICDSIADHPFPILADLGFLVTVSCDNRLQSRTTLTEEFALLCEAFGYGIEAVERFTVDAARAAFWDEDSRERLVTGTIRPAFAAARGVEPVPPPR